MDKVKDIALLALCILTLAGMDYSSIGILEIFIFISMGAAVILSAVYYVAKRKKDK